MLLFNLTWKEAWRKFFQRTSCLALSITEEKLHFLILIGLECPRDHIIGANFFIALPCIIVLLQLAVCNPSSLLMVVCMIILFYYFFCRGQMVKFFLGHLLINYLL